MEKKDLSLDIKNKKIWGLFLAPLAGISDAPFRSICLEEGADLVYSEMVSAKGLYYKDKKTEDLMKKMKKAEPLAIQIFGSDLESLEYAAKYISQTDVTLIDINMGCPVSKVVKNKEGSALMKDVPKAYQVAKTVVEASRVPVSVKFRSGFEKDSLNYLEFAKAMEEAGVSFITLHPRTRDMYYSGKANWDHIVEVRENVSIPVIANGDVYTYEDIEKIKEYTGCSAVMIGRGAMGNPWIFSGKTPSLEDRINTFKRHAQLQIEFCGEKRGIMEMRKHGAWYFKGFHKSAQFRNMIFTAKNMSDIHACLDYLRVEEEI